MPSQNYHKFKEKLDDHHTWPSLYMFKFIVPVDKVDEIQQLFPKADIQSRYSRNKKYIGITAQLVMDSSEAVMHIYEKAHQVDGVIAL